MKKKSYDATLFLGEITNTLDVEGEVIQKRKFQFYQKKKLQMYWITLLVIIIKLLLCFLQKK